MGLSAKWKCRTLAKEWIQDGDNTALNQAQSPSKCGAVCDYTGHMPGSQSWLGPQTQRDFPLTWELFAITLHQVFMRRVVETTRQSRPRCKGGGDWWLWINKLKAPLASWDPSPLQSQSLNPQAVGGTPNTMAAGRWQRSTVSGEAVDTKSIYSTHGIHHQQTCTTRNIQISL